MTAADSINDSSMPAGSLLGRTGAGKECILPPSLRVYAWSSKGVLAAARDSRDELTAIWPDAVILHGGTADLLANLRAAWAASVYEHPERASIARWVGVGIDGSLAAWHAGKLTAEQVVTRHAAVARLCHSLGVRWIVPNGESAWALSSASKRTTADVRALAAAVGRAYAVHAPDAALVLSTFGALGMHANVRALIEGFTPFCAALSGQSYAARKGPVKPGVLPGVLARDEKSQEATERQGWHRADETEGEDSPDDLDRFPTVQSHKTAPSDLCTVLCERTHALVWSVPMISESGRTDAEGLAALRAAAAIRRECGAGPGTVRRFQAAHGLEPDGRAGPLTRAAAIGGEP